MFEHPPARSPQGRLLTCQYKAARGEVCIRCHKQTLCVVLCVHPAGEGGELTAVQTAALVAGAALVAARSAGQRSEWDAELS